MRFVMFLLGLGLLALSCAPFKGEQGEPGENGIDLDTVHVIDPCVDVQDDNKEILLKINGVFIGTVTRNGKSYLSPLEPGLYRTKDRRQCRYEIQ